MNLLALLLCVVTLIPLQQGDYSHALNAKINGINYKAILNKDESVAIKINGKIVQSIPYNALTAFGSIFNLTFVDFDKDGYKDLLIEYTNNTPGICDLWLYNSVNKRFIRVKGFSDYPAPIRILHSHVYYSYHHSGCADQDWDSDLFKIKNNKAVTIGTISGRDCGEDETGIFVYRCGRSGKQLVKKMSIQKLNNYKDTKWGLIADYWNHNYKKFQL
jgi:hypothetical protein